MKYCNKQQRVRKVHVYQCEVIGMEDAVKSTLNALDLHQHSVCIRQSLVPPAGLEPATCGLEGRCSIH